MSNDTLRVGDVAAATGVSPRLLRYYEEQGLLAPGRSPAGQRQYSVDDIERVARIRRLLDAGLSTSVIAQILACLCGGSGDVEPCLDPLLRDELARIDARLAQLAQHRGRLVAIARHDESPGTQRVSRRDPGLLLKSKL